jgi:peptidoglycan hydrolase CwlO-like protein
MGVNFDTVFKAFKENATATIMTLLTIGISVMFTINQKTSSNVINEQRQANKDCVTEKFVLATQMDQMRGQIIDLTGAFKELKGEMNTLRKLGIVKE